MTANGWFQIIFFSAVLLLVTRPMGLYIVRVYDGTMRWLAPVERIIYRVCGIDPEEDQHWTRYASAVLLFSAVSMPGMARSAARARRSAGWMYWSLSSRANFLCGASERGKRQRPQRGASPDSVRTWFRCPQ